MKWIMCVLYTLKKLNYVYFLMTKIYFISVSYFNISVKRFLNKISVVVEFVIFLFLLVKETIIEDYSIPITNKFPYGIETYNIDFSYPLEFQVYLITD